MSAIAKLALTLESHVKAIAGGLGLTSDAVDATALGCTEHSASTTEGASTDFTLVLSESGP